MSRHSKAVDEENDEEASRQGFAKTLVEQYRAPLMRFFRRRVSNEAEAEDLAHDVLVRVISKSEPEKIENAEAFLFRTAANLLRDRARRNRTRYINYTEMAERQKAIEVLSPERVLQGRQSLQSLVSALEELSEKTRDIFLLHRLENMKYREIADLYGISQSAVEKHMMTSLAHIAKLIDDT